MERQIYMILKYLNKTPNKFVTCNELMKSFNMSYQDIISLVAVEMYKRKLITRTYTNSFKITIQGKLLINDYSSNFFKSFINNWIAPHWTQILIWFLIGCSVIYLLIQSLIK